MGKLFIVYDGRAIPREHLPKEAKDLMKKDGRKQFADMFFPGNTEDASVLVSCQSLKEARSYKGDFGDGNCIYSYDIKGKELINEKFVEIL